MGKAFQHSLEAFEDLTDKIFRLLIAHRFGPMTEAKSTIGTT